jgi:hypothetical protein
LEFEALVARAFRLVAFGFSTEAALGAEIFLGFRADVGIFCDLMAII